MQFLLLATIHRAASGKYVTTQYLSKYVRARSEGIRKYRELSSDPPPNNVVIALYQKCSSGITYSPLLYKKDQLLSSTKLQLKKLRELREKSIEKSLNPFTDKSSMSQPL